MTYLKPCPRCQATGQQRNGPASFCSCSDLDCPVSNIRIPLQAWQSWPRDSSGVGSGRPSNNPPAVVSANEHQQRVREIKLLQQRLSEFGTVEADNLQLRTTITAAQEQLKQQAHQIKQAEENLAAAEKSCAAMRAERGKQWTNLENVAQQRDAAQVVVKNLAKRIQDGCRVSRNSHDDSAAALYEELLGVLGNHDAAMVPCLKCGQLPSRVVDRFNTDMLQCSCFKQVCTTTGVGWTPKEWLQRRTGTAWALDRSVHKSTKTKSKPKTGLDETKFRANVKQARYFAGQYSSTGDMALKLAADQTELLCRLVKLVEKQ